MMLSKKTAWADTDSRTFGKTCSLEVSRSPICRTETLPNGDEVVMQRTSRRTTTLRLDGREAGYGR